MLRALEAAGYEGWYDLEVLSDNGMFGHNYPDSLWQVPPVELVSRARAAFERLWTSGRGSAGVAPGVEQERAEKLSARDGAKFKIEFAQHV